MKGMWNVIYLFTYLGGLRQTIGVCVCGVAIGMVSTFQERWDLEVWEVEVGMGGNGPTRFEKRLVWLAQKRLFFVSSWGAGKMGLNK